MYAHTHTIESTQVTYIHRHKYIKQELYDVDAFDGLYRNQATAKNIHVTESVRGI